MVGVGEDNLSLTGAQLLGGHALYRGVGADRHKYRSLDAAVRCLEQPGPGGGFVAPLNREPESVVGRIFAHKTVYIG